MHDTSSLADLDLLRLLAQESDSEALITLYRRYQGPIYRFSLQMSGSESVAEDVTQEVFLALMRDSSKFDPDRGSFAAYLFGIARNQVRRILGRGSVLSLVTEDTEDDSGLNSILIVPDDPLANLTKMEDLNALRQSILALPVHYREVVVLCDLEEMSYADAAAALTCAVGTIRSRLHRAHAILIQKLREEGNRPASRLRSNSRCFA